MESLISEFILALRKGNSTLYKQKDREITFPHVLSYRYMGKTLLIERKKLQSPCLVVEKKEQMSATKKWGR